MIAICARVVDHISNAKNSLALSMYSGLQESSQGVYAFLAATIISTFFIGVTFGLAYPLTALTLEGSQQPSWILGLAGAAPSLGVILFLPMLSRLISKVGSVQAVLLGSVLSAAGYVALYTFSGPWVWIVIRFFMGVFLAAGWLITQMWTTIAAPPRISGRVMAAYVLAFSGGNAICPLLINVTGVEGPEPFIVGAIVSLLAAVPILPVGARAPATDMGEVGGLGHMLRVAPLPVICCLLSGFVELSCFALITKVALASGLNTDEALRLLTAFLIGAMLLQFVVGWLADAIKPVWIGIGLCLISAAATVSLPWGLTHEATAGAAMFLLGGVAYGIYTVAMAVLSEEGAEADHSVGNVAIITSYQAGGVIGPLVGGAAMTVAPMAGFVAAVTTASLLAGIMIAIIQSKR